jgi:agmatine deiminase
MPRTLLTSDHGFAMPAEWSPHAATWMGWPCDDELWVGELEPVRREFADLVRTIAAYEPVELLVRDGEAETDAAERLAGVDVRLHRVAYDDVWLRDSGPIFVARDGRLRLTNWEFNGWGGKYDAAIDNDVPRRVAGILGTSTVDTGVVLEGGSVDVNGAGCVLTTRQCLLSPRRNAALSERELETLLAAYLGTPRVFWLDRGLEGDHTDGHIDTITRFTDERTIVTVTCTDRADANYETTLHNLELVRSLRDAAGVPFRVVTLPLPETRVEFDGQRLPLTYANFYIVNGAVVVPTYGDPSDARALEILRPLFPGRDVRGVPARHLITGGGAFHCVTQQQPAGLMALGADLQASHRSSEA